MSTILFDQIIFGPVKSRRLGNSLGINLLPLDHKFCNFDCVYCECGWTEHYKDAGKNLPQPFNVTEPLISKLIELNARGEKVDSITFAGNGEPTLHPKFNAIMEDVILARDLLLPETMISVLTNGTMLHNDRVKESLKKADHCIIKFDAGTEELFQLINRPTGGVSLGRIKKHLSDLKGEVSIQSLFFKGTYNGEIIDNTAEKELQAWEKHMVDIQPREVMLYSLDRNTPAADLHPVSKEELLSIAARLEEKGIRTLVV